MAKLKPKYRDLLNPYGEIFGKMSDKIFQMPDSELQELSKAVNAVDSTNCWCMVYDAAQWLRERIDDEFRRRKYAAAHAASKLSSNK